MKPKPDFIMRPQPTETSCGPTCLHSIYNFYNDQTDLPSIINEVENLTEGGTLAVLLGNHALKRGYGATLYSYNLQVFDPSWKKLSAKKLIEKLTLSLAAQKNSKLKLALSAHIEFLNLGGAILFDDLTPDLVKSLLKKKQPVLSGLSSTYLYGAKRESAIDGSENDLGGQPTGHFVILHGYNSAAKSVKLADPWKKHPFGKSLTYEIPMQKLINAIMLGVLTYDANLLVIDPPPELPEASKNSDFDSRANFKGIKKETQWQI